MEQETLNKRLGRRYLLTGIVLVLVVAIGVGLFFHYNKSAPKPSNKSICTTKVTSGSCNKTSHPSVAVAKPSSPKSSPSKTPTAISNPNASSTTQLSNTGPGNVVVLFIGVSFISALLYNTYQRLRIKLEESS